MYIYAMLRINQCQLEERSTPACEPWLTVRNSICMFYQISALSLVNDSRPNILFFPVTVLQQLSLGWRGAWHHQLWRRNGRKSKYRLHEAKTQYVSSLQAVWKRASILVPMSGWHLMNSSLPSTWGNGVTSAMPVMQTPSRIYTVIHPTSTFLCQGIKQIVSRT